jgi:hypothetical protein
METRWSRPLFIVAAAYEALLGIGFTFFARPIFEYFRVTPPNHYGYVQFPGLLLVVFAAMYWRISRDPVRYRDMMLYAIGCKASYCAVAFWYQFRGDIPSLWIPFAWADLAFLVLFVMAWRRATHLGSETAHA